MEITKRILLSITGISTPIFGLSWNLERLLNNKGESSRKKYKVFKFRQKTLYVTESNPKHVSLGIPPKHFYKVSSRINLENSESASGE